MPLLEAIVLLSLGNSELRERTLKLSVTPISAVTSETIDLSGSGSTAKAIENLATEFSSVMNGGSSKSADDFFVKMRGLVSNGNSLGSIQVIDPTEPTLSVPISTFDIEKVQVLKGAAEAYSKRFDAVLAGATSLSSGYIQQLSRPNLQVVLSQPGFMPSFQGPDMNKMQLIEPIMWERNMPYDRYVFDLAPGTLFVPENPEYQPMVAFRSFLHEFTPRGFEANMSELQDEAPSTRTLCASMNKKPPTLGVRYLPVPCKDPVIRGLALLSSFSRSTGAQDQARMWLYTDKVGLDQINKKLSPPIVPGYYTRALRDIDKLGGFTDKDHKNKDLYPPRLLLAPTGDQHAFAYLCKHLAEVFPQEARSILEKGASDEVAALFTPNAAELKQEHLDQMLENLLTTESDDVKLGMLTFLEKRIPTESRKMVKALDHFSEVEQLASSSNTKISDAAKKALAVFR